MTKLLWIRRRARRIINAFQLTSPGCSLDVRALGIRIAVFNAAQDWQNFNPQGKSK